MAACRSFAKHFLRRWAPDRWRSGRGAERGARSAGEGLCGPGGFHPPYRPSRAP